MSYVVLARSLHDLATTGRVLPHNAAALRDLVESPAFHVDELRHELRLANDAGDTDRAKQLVNALDELGASTEVADDAPVPLGPVAYVLDWVGDDPARARAALDAEERSESPRTTLVERLRQIVDDKES